MNETGMFALVDCNNYYVFCERVFRPSLVRRPVIVLSNNDGCAVSRSNEAKDLGVKMGQPWFRGREFAVFMVKFSSTFAAFIVVAESEVFFDQMVVRLEARQEGAAQALEVARFPVP